jgi:hypothetical protein
MNLDCLSCLLPDAARAERTRVRCRTRVARQQPAAHADPAAAPRSPLLAPAVIGGVCVLYLVALMTTSLRLDVFRP